MACNRYEGGRHDADGERKNYPMPATAYRVVVYNASQLAEAIFSSWVRSQECAQFRARTLNIACYKDTNPPAARLLSPPMTLEPFWHRTPVASASQIVDAAVRKSRYNNASGNA